MKALQLVDLDQAAGILCISTRTLERLVHDRKIKHYRIGRSLRFRVDELERFVADHAVPQMVV